jgi:ribosomal protein S18 acetylase RimI-like enzyme
MVYLLAQARERQMTRVSLEVIEANTGAHALYQQLDFEHQRYLLILEREPGPVNSFPAYMVEECPVGTALEYYAAFHDVPNCWQRGLRSLRALTPHSHAWTALSEGEIVGYAVGWASEYGVRLTDIATDPTVQARASIAQALLSDLHTRFGNVSGSSYNIAEDDPVLPAYEALGYRISFRQREMVRDLD